MEILSANRNERKEQVKDIITYGFVLKKQDQKQNLPLNGYPYTADFKLRPAKSDSRTTEGYISTTGVSKQFK